MQSFPTNKKRIPINDVFPNSWNSNQQSSSTFKKEIASIKERGFIQPIIVREVDGIHEIIDGEHRWRACKELEYTEIDVECIGSVSTVLAKSLTLDLNNLRGQDDILKRAAIIKQIKQGQGMLFAFDQSDIDAEISLLDFDFSQFKEPSITQDEKQNLLKSIKAGLSFENILRMIHSNSKNTEVKIMIENYFAWFSKFKEIVQK